MIGENVDDVGRFQLPVDPDSQTLPCELVDDVQHSVFSPVICAILDKVVRPDVVWILRAQSDAGSVFEPKAPTLLLLTRNFKPLPSPDPRDPLRVHSPAILPQHRRDAMIAIAAVLIGERSDVGS